MPRNNSGGNNVVTSYARAFGNTNIPAPPFRAPSPGNPGTTSTGMKGSNVKKGTPMHKGGATSGYKGSKA